MAQETFERKLTCNENKKTCTNHAPLGTALSNLGELTLIVGPQPRPSLGVALSKFVLKKFGEKLMSGRISTLRGKKMTPEKKTLV